MNIGNSSPLAGSDPATTQSGLIPPRPSGFGAGSFSTWGMKIFGMVQCAATSFSHDHDNRLGYLLFGISINGTLKWMVYFMENPMKVDDLGVPWGTPMT